MSESVRMYASTRPEIEWGGLSHIGPVREDNQDAILLPDCPPEGSEREGSTQSDSATEIQSATVLPGHLFGIADGMGGYSHGGLASQLALELLQKTILPDVLIRRLPIMKALRRGVEASNLGVFQAAQRLGAGPIGTTLTSGVIQDDQLYLAHVGDSRAYLIRDGQSTCLTNDHTTVGDLVRMKVLSPTQVRTHARRSILTKSVGLSLFVQPDLTQFGLMEGDRLILCSDGVWSVIQDEEFARLYPPGFQLGRSEPADHRPGIGPSNG